jgi:hypothetical protein
MRKGILLMAIILILTGCGASKHDPEPVIPPGKAVLLTPTQNEVCTTGTILSATQSTVRFSWSPTGHTASYEVVFKNLLTSAILTQKTTSTGIDITLDRNTPYSWHIVSLSSTTAETTDSDTWKFYNAGPGTVTYAPFPAEAVSPLFGTELVATTTTVNLSWKGSSVGPAATLTYDVYLGTTKTPVLQKGNSSDSFLNNVSVSSGKTYYWRVITKDAIGNSSDSGLFRFLVK